MRSRWIVAAAVAASMGLLLAFVYTAMRFCGWLLLAAAAAIIFWGLTERFCAVRWISVLRKTFLICLVLGMLLFSVLEIQVLRYGRTDHSRDVSAVIVLGAGVNGRTPSLSLLVRLQAALDYSKEHPKVPIVVSGGQGPGEDVTEARCMADWLIDHGVDRERILLEEQAVNTRENLQFSSAILADHGIDTTDNIAIVSSDYHLYRASLYWGLPSMVPVAAHMPERFLPLTVNYYIREAFGVAAILIGADQWLSGLT